MATFTKLLPKPLTSSFSTTPSCPIRSTAFLTRPVTSLTNRNQQHLIATRATPSGNTTTTTSSDPPPSKSDSADRVKRIHNIDQFDEALRLAKNKLVAVEYATAKSIKTEKIYPFMDELSRSCNDVVFLLVVGDESDRPLAICKREKVQQSPHFTFYKKIRHIHHCRLRQLMRALVFPVTSDEYQAATRKGVPGLFLLMYGRIGFC